MGERSDREQWCLLHSLLVFSHSLCYPQANWAFLVLIPGWVMLVDALYCCMWARGPIGSNGTCPTLCWFSVTSSATTIKLGPSGADFRVDGLVYILAPCWSLQGTPVRLGVSPAAASTPTGVFNQWFEALFPRWSSGLRSLSCGPLAAALLHASPLHLAAHLCPTY